MLQQLLGQSIGFLDGIYDWFTPFEFPQALVVTVIGIAIFVSIRLMLHQREPLYDKLGIYKFSMIHTGAHFNAVVYALHLDKKIDALIDAFESVHRNNLDDFQRVATLLDDNRHIAHAYLLRYVDAEGASKTHGWALMVTNAPLDDRRYYHPFALPIKNVIKGESTKMLMVGQCEVTGFIDNQVGKWEGQYDVDHIFYPFNPIRPGIPNSPQLIPPREITVEDGLAVQTTKLELIEPRYVSDEAIKNTARVLLRSVANMDQHVITLQKSHNLQIIAKAADERADKAESMARSYATQVNAERRQRLKKNYWSEQMTSTGSPLSLAIILMVVGGCAVFLPDFFAKTFVGYTMQHYIAASVAVGAVIVWLIGVFTDRRGSGVGGI